MPRKSIKSSTQASVLLHSRRRCSICYGLNRDTSLKQGQIAHLDQDSSNSAEDNLAFLCLEHHDQYDSSTKQSKNFTVEEVKQFREELHKATDMAFSKKVSFGQATAGQPDVVGHYIRSGEFDSAELTVQQLENGSFHVYGLALWGTSREHGPNIGELDFVGVLQEDMILHTEVFAGRAYAIVLRFSDVHLTVTEENWLGLYGMNVKFAGEYDLAT